MSADCPFNTYNISKVNVKYLLNRKNHSIELINNVSGQKIVWTHPCNRHSRSCNAIYQTEQQSNRNLHSLVIFVGKMDVTVLLQSFSRLQEQHEMCQTACHVLGFGLALVTTF